MTAEEIEAIVGGYHGDAFRILGPHSVRKKHGQPRWEVRAFLPQAESAEVLLRLLTADNRSLLRTIRDAKPQSVAELARLTARAEPNLLRTLAKLEAFGLVEMRTVDRRKVPTVTVGMLHLAIDPYTMADRIEGNTPYASNIVEDSRELLNSTLEAIHGEQAAQLPTERAQSLITLLRGIDGLTTSLASAIASETWEATAINGIWSDFRRSVKKPDTSAR